MQWAGIPEDQVVRRQRLQAQHPEVHIVSPGEPRAVLMGQIGWKAILPGGRAVQANELRDLLDSLESML